VHILRKTWIADDLTRKSHTQIKPELVVKTPIPDLGLGVVAQSTKPNAAGGAGGSAASASPSAKSSCSIRAPGSQPRQERNQTTSSVVAALALLFAFGARVRRRRGG
jgi:hypothetical protein